MRILPLSQPRPANPTYLIWALSSLGWPPINASSNQALRRCAGKDVYWYTREKADQDANEAAELLAVKQREEDLMAEVLSVHWPALCVPE